MPQYLARNGLYPTLLLYNSGDLIERVPTADEDTLIMVIIHGLSRFSMGELDRLFDELRTAAGQCATVVILSDIAFKTPYFIKTGIQFVEYDGDLFFGRYTFYENNKQKATTDSDDSVIQDILNERVKPEKAKWAHLRENFWEQFAEFTTPREIVEGDKPEPRTTVTQADDRYRDKLIRIELFDK